MTVRPQPQRPSSIPPAANLPSAKDLSLNKSPAEAEPGAVAKRNEAMMAQTLQSDTVQPTAIFKRPDRPMSDRMKNFLGLTDRNGDGNTMNFDPDNGPVRAFKLMQAGHWASITPPIKKIAGGRVYKTNDPHEIDAIAFSGLFQEVKVEDTDD